MLNHGHLSCIINYKTFYHLAKLLVIKTVTCMKVHSETFYLTVFVIV